MTITRRDRHAAMPRPQECVENQSGFCEKTEPSVHVDNLAISRKTRGIVTGVASRDRANSLSPFLKLDDYLATTTVKLSFFTLLEPPSSVHFLRSERIKK